MLKKCQNCGFYASHAEKICPNCQHKNSANHLKVTTLGDFMSPTHLSFFFCLIICLISLVILINLPVAEFLPIILISLLFFILSIVAMYLIINKRFSVSPMQHLENPLSDLDRKENIIEKRLSNLSQRGQQIDIVLEKIRQNDTEHLQNVRRRLLAAREIVIGQYARYELQAKKIELARLQNNVSPYLNSLHSLNEFEAANGLAAIEHTKHEIEQIRHNLTAYHAIDFPKSVQAEKESFLLQIADTEESCEKIREALVSQQATRALRGISPVEDTLKMPSSNEIAHAVDTFNIQSTLTDFSESFEELENEYRRVRAESEISEELMA